MENWKHIDWEKFHFLRAEYLWLGIPILIVILIGIFFYGEQNNWKKNIAKHLQPYVIQKGTEWKYRLIHFSLLLLFLLGFIAFLGPTWNEENAPSKKVASKLVIALDLSQSMLTEDISPNRLERAKFKINDFLKENPRAETELLVFAATTHVVVPFTTDYKIILDNLDGLQPKMMPRRGTGFPKLFERLDSIFTDNKAPGKVLLLSDDFQDIDIPMVSAFLQQNNVTLHIYPFATETGGAIRAFSNAKYPLKIKGKVEESALDTIKIKELKTIENLEVLDLTLDESDVRTLAKDISDNLLFEEKPKAEEENWEDNGYWLLIPLLVLFLFSFRKGWALYGLVFVMTLSSCSDVEKNPVNGKKEKFQFADLWYTKEYQAQKEYDNKNYTQAAEAFEDPLRKGVAYFKAGDLNKAKEAFEKDTSSTSKYNLALTYAKLGDLDKSQEIFTELVSKDPNNEDLKNNLLQVTKVMASMDTLQPEKVGLNEAKQTAKNKENDSQEDLGGGGQKATKKDMEKERLEETVDTGLRKGKELDELPDDFKSGKGEVPKNILMRKVDDDPALFLTRKFNYQVKKNQVTTEQTKTEW